MPLPPEYTDDEGLSRVTFQVLFPDGSSHWFTQRFRLEYSDTAEQAALEAESLALDYSDTTSGSAAGGTSIGEIVIDPMLGLI
jgi:hypothetical protein